MTESTDQDQTDYREAFTEFLANPPETANPTTLGVIGPMNAAMVENNVPMSKEHFEAATASIERGDSLLGFVQSENPYVLESTGSGWEYQAGLLFHEGLHEFNELIGNNVDAATQSEPQNQPESNNVGSYFDSKPDDPWGGSAWPGAPVLELPHYANHEYEVQVFEAIPVPLTEAPNFDDPSSMVGNEGLGTVADGVSELPDPSISVQPDPVAEHQSNGFFDGVQGFLAGIGVPSGEQPTPSPFGQLDSIFNSPSPEDATTAPSYGFSYEEPGHDLESPFQSHHLDEQSSWQEPMPSYDSAPADTHGHSGYDSGYSSHDSGSHDSGVGDSGSGDSD